MSLKYIYLLVLGSLVVSGGIMLLGTRLTRSKAISYKSKEETLEFFKSFKYLVKMQSIFILIGSILVFIINPIRFEVENGIIKAISIISLIYVLVACGLSVVNYNKLKMNYYKLFIKKK